MQVFNQVSRSSLPVGTVIDFAGSSIPADWLLCSGIPISRVNFADLFAVIGTTWGAGNGTSTFNLPNCGGVVIGGVGTGSTADGATSTRALADTIGKETHALDTTQIPNHSHTVASMPTAIATCNQGASPNGNVIITTGTVTSSSVGGGLAHPNMQPTIFMNKIIKYR